GDWISTLHFGADGRVLVVVEANDGVRMLAYADDAALRRTMDTGWAWFYSRSRQSHWQKGESSGHRLRVLEIATDCDRDAVRYRVDPEGPTCHTGAPSCFFDTVWPSGPALGRDAPAVPHAGNEATPASGSGRFAAAVSELLERIEARLAQRPEGSYVARLAEDPDLAIRKVGEEAVEVVVAAGAARRDPTLDPGRAREVVHEAADLLFHMLVLL